MSRKAKILTEKSNEYAKKMIEEYIEYIDTKINSIDNENDIYFLKKKKQIAKLLRGTIGRRTNNLYIDASREMRKSGNGKNREKVLEHVYNDVHNYDNLEEYLFVLLDVYFEILDTEAKDKPDNIKAVDSSLLDAFKYSIQDLSYENAYNLAMFIDKYYRNYAEEKFIYMIVEMIAAGEKDFSFIKDIENFLELNSKKFLNELLENNIKEVDIDSAKIVLCHLITMKFMNNIDKLKNNDGINKLNEVISKLYEKSDMFSILEFENGPVFNEVITNSLEENEFLVNFIELYNKFLTKEEPLFEDDSDFFEFHFLTFYKVTKYLKENKKQLRDLSMYIYLNTFNILDLSGMNSKIEYIDLNELIKYIEDFNKIEEDSYNFNSKYHRALSEMLLSKVIIADSVEISKEFEKDSFDLFKNPDKLLQFKFSEDFLDASAKLEYISKNKILPSLSIEILNSDLEISEIVTNANNELYYKNIIANKVKSYKSSTVASNVCMVCDNCDEIVMYLNNYEIINGSNNFITSGKLLKELANMSDADLNVMCRSLTDMCVENRKIFAYYDDMFVRKIIPTKTEDALIKDYTELRKDVDAKILAKKFNNKK